MEDFMKKILLSATIMALLVPAVNADTLGAEIGYATWSSKLTGDIKGSSAGDLSLDMKDDLGYSDKSTNDFLWVYFDHPVPIIPNLKVQKANYSDDASKSSSVTYDGKTYTGTVSTKLTLNQIDMIGYYRILDNWVNFDLGLNLKTIDGNLKISSTSGAAATDKDFKATIPMLYAKTRFDLPFTGLSIEADGSYIGFSGSKFSDLKAGVVYETSYGLGLTAGYKSQTLVLDDIDDTNTNISIKGMYAGLFYHF
jgi:outer membrane protein